MTGDPWWHSERHADRRVFLTGRNRIKRALEAWFDGEDFMPVECSALQISPGNETHLHAFATEFRTADGQTHPFYLHTSPEFACKKLLAAGEERIVDFARVYRNRETGPLHSPEFTMLEWYRTGVGLRAVVEDAIALCRAAQDVTKIRQFEWKGKTCDPRADVEFITLDDAFLRYAEIDLQSLLTERKLFAEVAADAGVPVSKDASWSDIFSAVLVSKIEPHLGDGRLTVLYRYPICEAALAAPCADDPRYADRFELYACGVELANGFHELTDPVVQRARFEEDMVLKEKLYGERYPLDEDFLNALEHMPNASGVALGFDRLVMLATGAPSVHHVMWTPFTL
tara:strand:- start:109116 stop:110141 length:1026 start_codon:yes stop_codon:yes gene_type:complete